MQWLRSTSVVALLLAAASPSIAGVDDVASQRAEQMKAAYLFNFLKFVEWPATTRSSINICFGAADSVHDSMKASTAGKKIGARGIVTSTLAISSSWSDCDVIYLGAAVDVQSLVQNTASSTALTVSEASEFTRSGGIIRLFTQDNRLRFDVNVANARRAGLKISSNLLKLASRVEQQQYGP